MGAAEPLEYPFGQHFFHGNGGVTERSRNTTSKFPHAQFLGQNVVDGLVIEIQFTTDHSDCQTSIRPQESPHFGHIFLRF
jgi:hypothetical protein